MWWCLPEILAFRRLWQKDHEFKASLGYIVKPLPPCFNSKTKKERKLLFGLKL
jgi:hypothetical protein